MADLNSLSNEELMSIAGISSSGPDLHSMSNEQLMQIAGIEAPQSDPSTLLGGGTRTQQRANMLVGGLSQIIPAFGDEIVAAAQAPIDAARRLYNDDPESIGEALSVLGDSYNSRLEKVRNYQQAFDDRLSQAGAVPSVFQKVGPALLVPTPNISSTLSTPARRIAGSVAEGGAVGGAFGFGEGEGLEDRLGRATLGAGVGGAAGGIARSALEGAAAIGSRLDDAGSALNRKSIGATYGDYYKTAKGSGIVDVGGELQPLTQRSLDDALESGVLGKTREPARMLQNLRTAEEKLAQDVGTLIDDFEKNVGSPIFPNFARAKQFLSDGNVPADKVAAYTKRLTTLENEIAQQGNGSLKFLQKQKIAHGKMWDPNDSTLNAFNREIYSDLQGAIEGVVPGVAPLNAELKVLKDIKPILERGTAKASNAEPIGGLTQAIRTSGGNLTTPTMIGGFTGGPVGATLGLAGGVLLNRASTPRGMATVAGILKRGGSVLESARGSNMPNEIAKLAGILTPQLGKEPDTAIQDTRRRETEIQSDKVQTPKASETKVPPKSPKIVSAESSLNPISLGTSPQSAEALRAAVIQVESGGRDDAVSPKGAIGKMQVTPIAMREVIRSRGGDDSKYSDADLRDIAKRAGMSEAFGTAYLQYLLDKYGDTELALAAYNGGPGRVDRLLKKTGGDSFDDIKSQLPSETSRYVPSVLSRLNIRKA